MVAKDSIWKVASKDFYATKRGHNHANLISPGTRLTVIENWKGLPVSTAGSDPRVAFLRGPAQYWCFESSFKTSCREAPAKANDSA
jgi:hypothetical protein